MQQLLLLADSIRNLCLILILSTVCVEHVCVLIVKTWTSSGCYNILPNLRDPLVDLLVTINYSFV